MTGTFGTDMAGGIHENQIHSYRRPRGRTWKAKHNLSHGLSSFGAGESDKKTRRGKWEQTWRLLQKQHLPSVVTDVNALWLFFFFGAALEEVQKRESTLMTDVSFGFEA